MVKPVGPGARMDTVARVTRQRLPLDSFRHRWNNLGATTGSPLDERVPFSFFRRCFQTGLFSVDNSASAGDAAAHAAAAAFSIPGMARLSSITSIKTPPRSHLHLFILPSFSLGVGVFLKGGPRSQVSIQAPLLPLAIFIIV